MELKYTYQDMPKDTIHIKGIRMVQGNTKEYRVKIKDITFNKEGVDIPIKLLIPERLDEVNNYPIYMHIQGSAWMKQDMNNHVEDLKYIAKQGYIVAIMGYRSTPHYLFPTQVKDAKSGVRYLYEHREELKINFEQAYIGGDSSGGHTALMCFVSYKTDLFDDEKTSFPEIKGFIDCYGPVNMSTMVEQVSGVDRSRGTTYPEMLLIGKEVRDDYELAQTTNPIEYLDKQTSPLLILHGNKDRLVPYVQSVELYQACKTKGINVDMICVDGADHGGSAFYTDEVLSNIIEFMKKYQ